LGSGVAVSRGFWLSFIAVSGAFAVLLAAYPSFDVQVAAWFFDPNTAKFPLSVDYEWNLVRRAANWVPSLLLAPGILALLRKLVFPDERMPIAPSVALFLIGSFLLGPGVTSNLLLKENWGRPRPNGVQQFAGSAAFQPWWQPGGECRRNCSFVSGEASQAFWTVAPASLAPPQLRPIALGAAVLFGTAVGGLRVAFGRHFVSDIIFAALLTVAIIFALYRLLLDPLRRNDARLERGVERVSVALHRLTGTILGGAGQALAGAGASLRSTGRHLQKRVACL
jgi:membrane-associated PAP2 superfamily phosphatase